MSWSPTSRDEQQSLVDMIGAARRSSQRSHGYAVDARQLRVVCSGDFPREALSAKLAADMIYGLEHDDAAQMGEDELVGRLARAKQDERRRRVVEALALQEMKQAAFTANGLVAQVALSSQVMAPEARAALKAQAADDGGWYDGMSYQGFLGEEAYQRALVKALPAAADALEAFLATLKKETGLWCVYDAIRDVSQPSYYRAYAEEYLASLQLEGDAVLERAAAESGSSSRYLEEIDSLRLRLPSDTYRLVDMLTKEMLMAEEGYDRWSRRSGPPSSLGEILSQIRAELDRRGWREAREASAALAAKRKREDPHYRQLLDAESKDKSRSAAELVAASASAAAEPSSFVFPFKGPAAGLHVPAANSEWKSPRLSCFFHRGHDYHWREPRKEYGLWFVKEVCARCHEERDYQIGSSSENGQRWSADGGSGPPPKKYWALRAHGHKKSAGKKAGEFVGGALLLTLLAAIPLALIAVAIIFGLGLSEGIKMSERPTVVGTLRPGLIAQANHGAWRWQGTHFLFFNSGPEAYAVQDSQWSYRWQRCDHGRCHDIPGATSANYTVQPGDSGKYLRFWVHIGPPPGKLVYKDIADVASAPRRALGSG